MPTYTFKSVTGGTAKFKSSGNYHIPAERPSIEEATDNLVFCAGLHAFTINPTTDTVVIDSTSHAPGSLTVSALSDLLNVLFPKATATQGAGSSSSLAFSWDIAINNSGVLSTVTVGDIALLSPDNTAWEIKKNTNGAIVADSDTILTGVASITRTSPDNSIWTITINNSGVLSQTKP